MTEVQVPFPWTAESSPRPRCLSSHSMSTRSCLGHGIPPGEVLEGEVGALDWGACQGGGPRGNTRQTQRLGLVARASGQLSIFLCCSYSLLPLWVTICWHRVRNHWVPLSSGWPGTGFPSSFHLLPRLTGLRGEACANAPCCQSIRTTRLSGISPSACSGVFCFQHHQSVNSILT